MSQLEAEKGGSMSDMRQLVAIIERQSRDTAGKLNELASQVTELVRVTIRAEERHIAQSKGLERIDRDFKEFLKEQKAYNSSNDARSIDIEKLILELKFKGDTNSGRWEKVDKIKVGLLNNYYSGITALLIAAVLAYLGLK